jgi:hypothetical protein
MKTGTSTLMDSELNKSSNYAEEWEIGPPPEEAGTLTFGTPFTQLNYVGCYSVGGLSIYLEKRPKWLHRRMMKLCLGWEWIDN